MQIGFDDYEIRVLIASASLVDDGSRKLIA